MVGDIVIATDGRMYNISIVKPVFEDYRDDPFLNSLEPASFSYTKDGKNYSAELYPRLLPAMSWIRDSTPKQAIFLSWWDHGHMIRGVAERNVIIFGPSREILYTVSKYARLSKEELSKIECPECNPHERVMDVVDALITSDPNRTKNIMKKYNSEYVLVTESDRATVMHFLIAGYDPSTYLDEGHKPKENAMQLVLFKMIDGKAVRGFEKVYSDRMVRIYKIRD